MYENPKGSIGCVFVNGKDITMIQIDPFNSKLFKLTKKYDSGMRLMSRTRRGGSSAGRFSRYRDLARKNHLSEISSTTLDIFFDFNTHSQCVDILVICGPAMMKQELGEMPDVKKYFGKSLVIISIDHLDPQIILDRVYGLLIDKKDNRIHKPQQLFETQPDQIIIGEKEIEQHIEECNLKELYVNSPSLSRNFSKLIKHSVEIILIENSTFLTSMGGFIGIKYY